MISVVIPLYNKESTIERTIASVLAQSVTDWELIIVDDGSTDNSLALARRFEDPRIRLVTQANAGVSAARNHGVEQSSNSIVAFVDADDYWAPAHLASIKQLLGRFPDASIFATAYFIVDEAGRVRKTRLRDETDNLEKQLALDYFTAALGVAPPVCSSAVAVSKAAFKKIGGFPLGIKAGEDLLTWARLACVGNVAYSMIATAYIAAPPVSVARNHNAIRRPAKPDIVGNELAKLDLKYGQVRSGLRRYRGDWYRMRATLFMELGERVDCLIELTKSVKASGIRFRDVVSLGLLLLPTRVRANLLSRWRQRHVVSANAIQ